MTVVLVLWISFMVAMVIVPAGRRALRQAFRDVGHVLGFQPQPVRPRARLALDPADRRAAEVAAAYVAGRFGYDELEWRILLALCPPPPDCWRKAMAERMMERVDVSGVSAGSVVTLSTDSVPWSAATNVIHYNVLANRALCSVRIAKMEEGDGCCFRELHSGSGYIGTVCDCGHDMATHYNGGCNDCDALARMAAPPKPNDAARSVLPARAHGDLSM